MLADGWIVAGGNLVSVFVGVAGSGAGGTDAGTSAAAVSRRLAGNLGSQCGGVSAGPAGRQWERWSDAAKPAVAGGCRSGAGAALAHARAVQLPARQSVEVGADVRRELSGGVPVPPRPGRGVERQPAGGPDAVSAFPVSGHAGNI